MAQCLVWLTGLLGSPEIYSHMGREAEQSINFVTCHDSFTLNDLFSYNHKHNEANGENNRDGGDDNSNWNCGVEGPTDDKKIEALRSRQIKNALTINMLSLGIPMILMGNKLRHTQSGNNNTYCQDNELNWFDWARVTQYADLHRFFAMLAERRLLRNMEAEERKISLNQLLKNAKITWHGAQLNQPDWRDNSHSLAFCADLIKEKITIFLIFNAYWEPIEFELPKSAQPWKRWIDTSMDSPSDIVDRRKAPTISGKKYPAGPRSSVALFIKE